MLYIKLHFILYACCAVNNSFNRYLISRKVYFSTTLYCFSVNSDFDPIIICYLKLQL